MNFQFGIPFGILGILIDSEVFYSFNNVDFSMLYMRARNKGEIEFEVHDGLDNSLSLKS